MVKIIVKESKIHGKGVFAMEDIPKGTEIVQYTGELISKAEAEQRSKRDDKTGIVLLFELNDKYDIDGGSNGGNARFINSSCKPNSEAINYGGEEIWIVAVRDIKKGEEITYDYGFKEDVKCKCGHC